MKEFTLNLEPYTPYPIPRTLNPKPQAYFTGARWTKKTKRTHKPVAHHSIYCYNAVKIDKRHMIQ